MKPLVTIIIPCYNYGRYLGSAIESALSQTYRPLEIIVLNDGSSDSTVKVASKYPVKLYSFEHQGASATFNKGIELSQGDFIVKLDADDQLSPSFVEKTLYILEERKEAAFVYTHAFLFGNRTGRMLSRPYSIDTLKISNYIFGTALVKREAFQIGGCFDTSLLCLEDYDLWLTFAQKGLFGQLLAEPLFYYRQHIKSRNAYTKLKFRITMIKIWKKHRGLYSLGELIRVIILGRVSAILVSFLDFMEEIVPHSVQKKIAKVRAEIRFRNGCIILDE
jgi:glycosyltransferase involved in cell wall biosynthesis